MPERNIPSSDDIRAMIRRVGEVARGERPDEVLSRMDRDDQRDEADSFGEDSGSAPSHINESSAWFDSDKFSPASPAGERATIDPPDAAPLSSSEPEEPSLSNPSPSVRGTTSSLSTLVVTQTFRPTRRPPMAVLRVYDDDQRDAETVRIRQTPFIIGRQDGELVIGHERQMSRRHARIDRMQEDDAWRWYLGDLRSTNGTFQRVDQTPLQDGTEVLLGGELVRFVESASGEAPCLVRVGSSTNEERVTLTGESHLVGTDSAACLSFLSAAPFLDPCHYRVERRSNRWRVLDLGSTNHLWAAITKRVELTTGSMFQIGEQRFSFHLP